MTIKSRLNIYKLKFLPSISMEYKKIIIDNNSNFKRMDGLSFDTKVFVTANNQINCELGYGVDWKNDESMPGSRKFARFLFNL
jgi:hypothetical protein